MWIAAPAVWLSFAGYGYWIASIRQTPHAEGLLFGLLLGPIGCIFEKSVPSLAQPLQVGMDNGARRALVPLEKKRNFLEVSGDIVERVDPVFFSDPMTAAMKALGMT